MNLSRVVISGGLMTDKQRLYCRLDEASDVLSTSQGALLEAMEDRSLTLLVRLSAKNLIGFLVKDGKRTCLGCFDYDGVVEPRFDDAKAILNGRGGLVRFCNILEPQKIRHWRELAGDEMPFPNNLFQRYHHIEQPQMMISAACNVSYSADSTSVFAALQSMLDNPQRITSPQDVMTDVKKMVSVHGHRIFLNDIRFNIVEMTKSKDVIHSFESTGLDVFGPHKYDGLKKVIYLLLSSFPNERSDRLWNFLRNDVDQKSYARRFDVDNVIDVMTQGSIEWFGKGVDTVNHTTRKTFQNILSELRKEIKLRE